ncbi:DUF1284 domain-containing protein [Bengtsoniella intestinalis]|uniref:DUF1284 domain-containing protein n=1 Tax=Bengtsoniella intestinalis TaxID=3073143 RepID=UPI00391EFD84
MCPFELRPHHGLCLQFFRGEGYSPAFIENMTAMVAALSNNPQIKLVTGGDSICSTCPNGLADGKCTCDDKVLRYDEGVLALCDLSYSQTLSWVDFSQKIHTEILAKHLRQQVCGDCQWNHLCQE